MVHPPPPAPYVQPNSKGGKDGRVWQGGNDGRKEQDSKGSKGDF